MWNIEQGKQKKTDFLFCPEEAPRRQDTRSLTQVGSKQPEQERTGTAAFHPNSCLAAPPSARRVKALNGLGTFSISTEAPWPAQINQRTPPKKVTFSATLECNYHVLNSLTPPHLHPPLFCLFSEGFLFHFRAKITLSSVKEGERLFFLFIF